MASDGVKSEKEIAKEKAKAEKLAKFQAKQAANKQQPKAQADGAAAPSAKEKKKKEKAEEVVEEYVEETPKGEKKILKPLDKAYNPKAIESAWNDWWEAEGFFKPEFKPDGKVKDKGSFTIVIPPPNVTGALHCGHAIATTLQDSLIRWHRMRGFTTLYIPGCDHAGIATQTVVEKMLFRRENKTRHDLGRAAFIEKTHEWKEEYHQKINYVLRRLGGSFDWSREAFTMSPELSEAVSETFVQLHEEGYIYRSGRLVNWCSQLSTALSNIEVDYKELTGRTLLDVPGYERKVEFGVISHFKYPIEDSDETVEVATTRIETMLGDTAIAVHPKDERYKHLVGKYAKHPFIEGRMLKIVADDYVDPEFGTGAVKITPAHDPNDFAIGQRHKLEFINILNDDGTLNENTGPFQGKRRFDVRYEVAQELEKLGLFVKKEDNAMRVPLCSRTKDVIEPLMRPQWWMKMDELAEAARKVVVDGDLKIKPEFSQKQYMSWLNGIQDWCLSRQLWWGHQIPAYFVQLEGKPLDDTKDESWVVGRTEEEAKKKASERFPGQKFTLRRDEDVLDTWFSSGLWPFSTLGWPKETHDLQNLFPTSVLETGWDIIFFWVIRMVVLSLKLRGTIPFHEVYCHALVRDSEGRKMSKSLGNVIDPVDIMEGITLKALHDKLHTGNLDPKEVKNAEKYQKTAFPQGIPECGADALRFSLISYSAGNTDINFDIKVMAAYRRFCNKIFQAFKYVQGKIGEDFVPNETGALTGNESLPERWILHKFTMAAKNINQALQDREFSASAQLLYQYWYDELCDVYIENSKALISDGTPTQQASALQTLYTALSGALTLLHPYMPFITEELWQRLPRRPNDTTKSITIAAYPEYDASLDDPASERAYELVLGCARGIRSLAAEFGVKEGIEVVVRAVDQEAKRTVEEQGSAIRALAPRGLANLTVITAEQAAPEGCALFFVSSRATVYLNIAKSEGLEPAKEVEKATLKRDQAVAAVGKQKEFVKGMEGTASKSAIEAEGKRLGEMEAEAKVLGEAIEQFEALKV